MKTSHRIFIIVLAFAVGITTILAFVVWPSIQSITVLARAIEQEQSRTERLLHRISQLQKAKKDIEMIKSGLTEWGAFTVQKGKEVDFFALLEKKNNTYELDQIVRLEEMKDGLFGLEELPLTMQIEGPFINTLRYMQELEQSPTLVPLNTIELQMPLTPTGVPKLHSTLKATLYVVKN